jgi:tetratricopeptide (TPR) repeat protein
MNHDNDEPVSQVTTARRQSIAHLLRSAENAHQQTNYLLCLQLAGEAHMAAVSAGLLQDEADALRLHAIAYDQLGAYEQALENGLHALERFSAANDDLGRAACYRLIGIVHGKCSEHAKALDMYQQALLVYEAEDDQIQRAGTLLNMGIALKNLGRLAEARQVQELSLAIFERTSNVRGRVMLQVNLALTLELSGMPEKAEVLLIDTVRLATMADMEEASLSARRTLGEIFLRSGRFDEAQEPLCLALKQAGDAGLKREQAAAHRALVDLHKAKGRPADALAHFEAFYGLDREMFNDAGDRKLKALQVRYEVEKLTREASQDGLTGLYNRRFLDRQLQSLWSTVSQGGTTLAVAMVDVDHFKKINDQYGHSCGDEVLRHVGKLLRSQCRNSDLAARYGGEEFTMVMPNTDGEGL